MSWHLRVLGGDVEEEDGMGWVGMRRSGCVVRWISEHGICIVLHNLMKLQVSPQSSALLPSLATG